MDEAASKIQNGINSARGTGCWTEKPMQLEIGEAIAQKKGESKLKSWA
jgi:hypothetical protein